MKQQEWKFLDKSAWGEGPWQAEPDKAQWQDPATGLPCLAVRGPMGSWCGYVGVAPNHPLHGVGYSQDCELLGKQLKQRLARPVGERPSLAMLIAAVSGEKPDPSPDIVFEVHGGLTFSGACQEHQDGHGICHIPEPGEEEHVWWLGFDCAHGGDYMPGHNARLREIAPELANTPMHMEEQYRTLPYVQAECASLAAQLKVVQ